MVPDIRLFRTWIKFEYYGFCWIDLKFFRVFFSQTHAVLIVLKSGAISIADAFSVCQLGSQLKCQRKDKGGSQDG